MDGFDALGSVVEAIKNPGIVKESRKDVFRDEFDNIVIDTVKPFDTGIWETGISRDGKWVIVEQYDDRQSAKMGHSGWVMEMKKNPDAELTDVLWG